jgi:hypothetical protein
MNANIDDETLKKFLILLLSIQIETVKSLQNEVKMSTNIVKDTGILPNHMSKVLKS